MDKKLQDKITSVIDDVDDMTIATVREDGYPQATTVSYVNDGLTVYFATDKNSQKANNIAKNNKVSLTIDRNYQHWNDIESLSIGAIAEPVHNAEEIEKVSGLMFDKFPEVTQYASDGLEDVAFFRIQPEVISLLDYSRGFGHTELIKL